jgi:DNA-binding SARP family transcriptional activator
MWFGILGSLLVRDGDVEVIISGMRQRVLLAALLMRAGTVIPPEALAELVWDEAPPASAAVTLRSHVLRLRRALGPGPGSRVMTRYPGYLLLAGTEEVDLLRFRFLCRDGAAASRAGDWEQACALLDEALGLWRGTPLSDVPSELLRREELPGLEEMRLRAEEWWIDASLHLGSHPELIPVLRATTAKHPLRERFHAQLMVALYRDGRQAEALSAYRDAHRVLAAELGTEPGPELRKLQQQIPTPTPPSTCPIRHQGLASGRA